QGEVAGEPAVVFGQLLQVGGDDLVHRGRGDERAADRLPGRRRGRLFGHGRRRAGFRGGGAGGGPARRQAAALLAGSGGCLGGAPGWGRCGGGGHPAVRQGAERGRRGRRGPRHQELAGHEPVAVEDEVEAAFGGTVLAVTAVAVRLKEGVNLLRQLPPVGRQG